VLRDVSGGALDVPLELTPDLRQFRDRAYAIRGEPDLRSGPREADDGDAIGGADPRPDKGFRRPARDLLVPGRDM